MKLHRNSINSILMTLSLVSNFVYAKTVNRAYSSEDISYYDCDINYDYDDDLQEKTQENGANLVLPIVVMMIIIGAICYCCAGSSKEKSNDVVPPNNNGDLNINMRNTASASPDQETEKRCLLQIKLKNGVIFSVFFGDILEWQGNQKEEGKKFIVCSPDNSNLHPNDGLAHKICRKIGGKEETKEGTDKGNWVYPDQSDLRKKLKESNDDHSEDLKVGSGVLGQGVDDFDVWHLVGPCVNSAGTKLTGAQKKQLKDAYLNAIIGTSDKKDDSGNCLYSSINMCSVSDAIFNVTSAESAEALAEALLNFNEQSSQGLKHINLVIHSGYNGVRNDANKNLKRSDVFINVIKEKLINDEHRAILL